MSEPKPSADAPPGPFRRLPRRSIWVCGLLLLISPFVASWYGYWLSTDSVQVEFPVDAIVILGGYNRHELAAEWVRMGRCREIWMISTPLTPMVRLGLERPAAEVNLERLTVLGVSPTVIRQVTANIKPRDVPAALRAIDELRQQQGAGQIAVTCQSLETRFMRQIANAALPPESSFRIQFIELPSDRYASTRWWMSRTGLKDTWNQTLQILGNWWDGPTGGFDEVEWDPETWEPPRREAAP